MFLSIVSLTLIIFLRTLCEIMFEFIQTAIIESWKATSKLLWSPFSFSFVFKLSLVIIMAGCLAIPGFHGSVGGDQNFSGEASFHSLEKMGYNPEDILNLGIIIITIIGIVIFFIILFLYWIGSLFNFVFVDVLITQEKKISAAIGRSISHSWSLFLWCTIFAIFSLGLTILVNIIISRIEQSSGFFFGMMFLSVIFSFVIAIIIAVFLMFSFEWVVPVMRQKNCGFIAGWVDVLSIIISSPLKILIYAILRFCITIAGGMYSVFLAIFTILIYCIIFGIPVLIVGMIIGFNSNSFDPLWLLMLFPVGLIFGLFVFHTIVLFYVPVVVYKRYFSLSVLGQIYPEYDFMPKTEPPEVPPVVLEEAFVEDEEKTDLSAEPTELPPEQYKD